MTKKIDETCNFHKALEKMEREGLLRGDGSKIVGVLMDISLSLARITDALEKLSEVEK